MKRGREYYGCVEENNMDLRKRGALSYSIKIKAVGKNIKLGRGEGDENLGEGNKWGGEEYQVVWNFIH